jgi:ADP-heptose:LPS heptosyltransferase
LIPYQYSSGFIKALSDHHPGLLALRRVFGHFMVIGIAFAFALLHGLLEINSWFRGRTPGEAMRRYARLKSGFLHGLNSFQWSWYWTVDAQPVWRVVRYILMLEIADLIGRIRKMPLSNRIVVLQLAHIGDFIVSLPALRALWQQHGAAMTLVVSPWSEELARSALPECRIEVHRTAWGSVTRYGARVGVLAELQSIWKLLKDRPAQIIDFGPPWPVDLLFTVIGHPGQYVGQAKPYWYEFDYSGDFVVVPLQDHALTTAGMILQKAGVSVPQPWTRSSGCQAWIASLTPEQCWPDHLVSYDRFVCMGVGAGWDGKRWPVDRFARVAVKLVEEHGVSVVFLGSAAERDLAEQAAVGLASVDYLNLCGRTSLPQAIGLIKHAEMLVCNDSGLLHMAGLTATPSIAFFMPGNAKYWNPEGEMHVAIEASGECPCSRYPVGACRNIADPCMKRFGYDTVQDAVKRHMRNLNHGLTRMSGENFNNASSA